MARFELSGPNAGKTVVLGGRYAFVNGVLECNEDDAHLITNTLREFYQATRVSDKPVVPVAEPVAEPKKVVK